MRNEKLEISREFVNCTNMDIWLMMPEYLLKKDHAITCKSVSYNNIITPVEWSDHSTTKSIYIINGIKDAIRLSRTLDYIDPEFIYEPCREDMKRRIINRMHDCYQVTSFRSVGTFTKFIMKCANLFSVRNECGLCGTCTMEGACGSTKK